ncbi:hypothetical protein EJ05DRAFT_481726 [Pseudovirgaria hyperparasitica]|uniref:Uncharacterized protein n=1 Tax=Pseudovirgaria hyperparasitica TaxID=470096 RepID=A0A6A6WLG6_9PEZI|nr:uncharacterized protein EJ05DRAFT_481726 [Pseudovirgaria hyperparasitica]KAF2762849.1 hypothetical protein EJ05DRAFT_481726 [Pseudovirgaria hyperparasitica]
MTWGYRCNLSVEVSKDETLRELYPWTEPRRSWERDLTCLKSPNACDYSRAPIRGSWLGLPIVEARSPVHGARLFVATASRSAGAGAFAHCQRRGSVRWAAASSSAVSTGCPLSDVSDPPLLDTTIDNSKAVIYYVPPHSQTNRAVPLLYLNNKT